MTVSDKRANVETMDEKTELENAVFEAQEAYDKQLFKDPECIGFERRALDLAKENLEEWERDNLHDEPYSSRKFLEELAFRTAATAFLVEPLPENWFDLDEEELSGFVQDHTWQPLEMRRPDEIIGLICQHAESVVDAMKQTMRSVETVLVEMAIDGTFPSDLNELDLYGIASELPVN